MMDEKDAIALTAMAIGSTKGTVDNSVCDNGNATVNKETFETMMNSIDSRLSTLNKSVTNLNEELSDIDKRVNRLEYKGRCANTVEVTTIIELRRDLQSLMYKVEQMDAALSMSKKYRKRRAKVSKN